MVLNDVVKHGNTTTHKLKSKEIDGKFNLRTRGGGGGSPLCEVMETCQNLGCTFVGVWSGFLTSLTRNFQDYVVVHHAGNIDKNMRLLHNPVSPLPNQVRSFCFVCDHLATRNSVRNPLRLVRSSNLLVRYMHLLPKCLGFKGKNLKFCWTKYS